MKGKDGSKIGMFGLVLGLCLVAAPSMVGAQAWYDNDSEQKSNDPKYNYRRSEHFRITWAKGVAVTSEKDANGNFKPDTGANGGFKEVTEQLVQGNLQMLEAVFSKFHDPESASGMGFRSTGKSVNPEKNVDDKNYRNNLIISCTGNFASGAWGGADAAGYPIFALPPGYLAYDPPSGATPHEYNHTNIINAGGFNDTPYDGMWHEATSNWFMLQFNNAYPLPGGSIQPYLSIPHGRNYYDAWPILEYLREQPGYGYSFVNKLWTEGKGNKAKGGKYMYDEIVRLDDKHGPDAYNHLKDQIGGMAAHSVTWDMERGQFFRKHLPANYDAFAESYRRGYTELTRRNGDQTWFRVPFAHAPQQVGYNLVPIALNGKTKGQPYQINVNFKPLWDPIRRSDMRATLVSVNDNGEPRYSDMWNGGINSITLSDDENRLFLVVSATPDFMGYEGFTRPLSSDLPLQPMSYEVSFPETKATAFESKFAKPENATGKAHSNGGGFVADTAKVDATAYVGPSAMVLGNAQVLGKARIGDFAVVMGNAIVKDNARVSGHALVKENAQIYGNGKVRDWATVSGNWKIYENGRALEGVTLMGGGDLHGCATEKGNACDYGNVQVKGTAIKEYDTANGCNLDKGTLMCWVWGTDQAYGDKQPDNLGIYCGFHFESRDAYADAAKLAADGSSTYGLDANGKPIVYDRSNSIYAHDTFGIVNGILMGSPKVVAVSDKALGNVLALNGKDQYVELHKDVSDLNDTTIAMWVNWAGGKADQKILNYGDGANKYAYITPKNAEGKLAFVISNSGKAGEQVLSANALAANTWTHVAVTVKGDTGTLYVNGKVAAESKMTLKPDDVLAQNSLAGNNCTFLGRGAVGDYFNGMIDDFRVYVMPQEPALIAKIAASVTDKSAKVVASAKDAAPMAPKFLVAPNAVSATAIQMSATRPESKTAWFEYSFKCTSGGGHNSGWISSNYWVDCNLKPGSYSYSVAMRNKDGVVSAVSAPASATISVPTAAPKAQFAYAPLGMSETAIKMVATKPADAFGKVEYKFNRADGKTTGWQSSPSWIDKSVSSGQSYGYVFEVRDARGKTGASESKKAMALDETPPARFNVGDWQTRPFSKVDNSLSMKAMNPNEWKIESDKIEYYFHCVSGGGPDSQWQESNVFTTSPLADGTYVYQFKMRDQKLNETTYSEKMPVSVTKFTGYHAYSVKDIGGLEEGSLVSFKGKVTGVEKDYYVVSADGAQVKVVPATVGDATDASFNGKDVAVNGGLWIVGTEKRVTWADVK